MITDSKKRFDDHLIFTTNMSVDPESGTINFEHTTDNAREKLFQLATSWVINTHDELTRKGLKALGWLSPEEALLLHVELANAHEEIQELEDELRVSQEKRDE